MQQGGVATLPVHWSAACDRPTVSRLTLLTSSLTQRRSRSLCIPHQRSSGDHRLFGCGIDGTSTFVGRCRPALRNSVRQAAVLEFSATEYNIIEFFNDD